MTRDPSSHANPTLRIGIDLDNTIVCYDRLFPELALAKGLVPQEAATSKHAVREHLRSVEREGAWTELQGEVYGPAMRGAVAFEGIHAFLAACAEAGWSAFIISHRTRHPYAGPNYDLHASALDWLRENGLLDMGDGSGLPPDCVFLETTLEAKLARIAELRCTHFIDDLPELLAHERFPSGVQRVLFDPRGAHAVTREVIRLESWSQASQRMARADSAAPPHPFPLSRGGERENNNGPPSSARP